MDAFYASVEQQQCPELKGRPVIVGGQPDTRGVVATCSYEARKYGIHSAMASYKAFQLCPQAVFLKPRMEVYQAVSVQIMQIFQEYTDLVEPLSLDEAYMDVTRDFKGLGSATITAQKILAKIREQTGLTASAGVSFNKFLAKVASDMQKPNGLTIIPPEKGLLFLETLPVGKFFGVGKKTENRMHALGIRTGLDLKKTGRERLAALFGKSGDFFYQTACGLDHRPICPQRTRKSIGREITLEEDINDSKMMLNLLEKIAGQLVILMENKKLLGRTITLKIKFHNFVSITRSITCDFPVTSSDIIMEHVKNLLVNSGTGSKKVRLLGITISNFYENRPGVYIQQPLPFKFSDYK